MISASLTTNGRKKRRNAPNVRKNADASGKQIRTISTLISDKGQAWLEI